MIGPLQRLRGRSLHELFTRAQQRLFTIRERAALTFGVNARSDTSRAHIYDWADSSGFSLRDAVPRRLAPPAESVFPRRTAFFPGLRNQATMLEALSARAPGDEAEIIARAEAVRRGDVNIFGCGLLHVGRPPRWHHDPVNDRTAPSGHWSTIPYLNPEIAGDHKVIWEINRHQFGVTLGQAWLYSGDEQWPALFVALVRSWIADNPPTVGMNWASSLEVSYRAISWLWALQLMRNADAVTDEFRSEILASLEAHGRHLERYLSTYFSPNTHLTGEALGLFYIGTQCSELRRAQHWKSHGATVLELALSRQVLSDGVYFEQASQYHRYTIEIYLHYLLLSRANGERVGATVEPALNKLFDVLLNLTRPDGTIPLVGDDDGGKLVALDERPPHDVRGLLAVGAVVFNRGDLAWAGRRDDAMMCWMLGSDAPVLRDRLIGKAPEHLAKAFVEGGLYVMRDGWQSTDGHMAIDGGPHGALSFGHSHADALSVELSVGGAPLFVDAGTYTYMGAERNEFRATAAHNTLEIDGISSSLPGTAFRWTSVVNSTVTQWVDGTDFTLFSGRHTAYASLPAPAIHERTVLRPSPGVWIVRDNVQTRGKHDVAIRWHCALGHRAESAVPPTGATVAGENCREAFFNINQHETPRAVVSFLGAAAATASVESGWVSPQFGRRERSDVCVIREAISGDASWVSVVLDWTKCRLYAPRAEVAARVRGARHQLFMRSLDAARSTHHVLMIGDGAPMSFDTVEIEAKMAWISYSPHSNRPIAVVALDVAQLARSGRVLVSNSNTVRWAAVHAVAGDGNADWIVHSEASARPS